MFWLFDQSKTLFFPEGFRGEKFSMVDVSSKTLINYRDSFHVHMTNKISSFYFIYAERYLLDAWKNTSAGNKDFFCI